MIVNRLFLTLGDRVVASTPSGPVYATVQYRAFTGRYVVLVDGEHEVTSFARPAMQLQRRVSGYICAQRTGGHTRADSDQEAVQAGEGQGRAAPRLTAERRAPAQRCPWAARRLAPPSG